MAGTFVMVVQDEPVEINEVFRNYTGSSGYLVANNLYSRLVVNEYYNPQVFPELATNWEILDGGSRYRFYLNRAAQWHDGVPLTAEDVVYTHREALRHGYHGAKFLPGVESIAAIEDHTVEYVLESPNAGFLTHLGNFIFAHILPKHLYEGTDWATNPHNKRPVGSGPFMFESWEEGKEVVLTRNPSYWGPPPGVDKIIFRVVPERDECIRMVTEGKAHYMPQDVLTSDRCWMVTGSEAEVSAHRGPGLAYLDFNHRRPLWRDPDLRRAVALAVDRDRLREMAVVGIAEPYDHYLPASVEWAFDARCRAPSPDREHAKELVQRIGVQERGERVSLYFMEVFESHRAIATSVAKDLLAVGLNVDVMALSSLEWARKIEGAHDFDLVITGGSMTPDPEIMASRFESTGMRNICGHHNVAVDRCFRDGRASLSKEQRASSYRKLQGEFKAADEFVPLFWYGTFFARSTRFFGWSDQLEFSIPWWSFGRLRELDM